MNDHTAISNPFAKFVSLWALIGVTSWSEAAAFLACIWSSLLIGEWVWKKVGRPFCVARGWVKPLTPAQQLVDEIDELAQQ